MGAQALPRGARVRVRLGEIDEITLDVHGTVIEHLDAETVEEASDEEDDTPTAGPIAIAVDMNEPAEASAPGSDNSSP
jgi:exoribonuclease-2